ncbi:MAG: peptide chain release factor 2, partial [Acidimicrobiales bacterium]|nr:peptide chain release factor 2 [Acidimicrobiales bacterium]
ADAEAQATAVDARLRKAELERMLSGPADQSNAIVHIKPGAGGTDAKDWAAMLLRMYLRWCERRGYKTEIIDYQEGDEAGIDDVSFTVAGDAAYGYLRSEVGVHRLVRMSPFNAQGKRQTAFAALKVTPFLEDVPDIVIDDKDLRIDTYRSSGAGGQHVNVTDSAVRITHLPTGVVTSCQNERSQHQNKDRAMQILKVKLAELERQKRIDELAAIRGEQRSVGFGSQIRSYVLQPYQMVKDLRSEHETGNVDAVLDGALDEFMESYLRWQRAQSLDDA